MCPRRAPLAAAVLWSWVAATGAAAPPPGGEEPPATLVRWQAWLGSSANDVVTAREPREYRRPGRRNRTRTPADSSTTTSNTSLPVDGGARQEEAPSPPSCGTNITWAPGQWAPGCYGVWTKHWNGCIPEVIREQIRASPTPELLERIERGQCPYGRLLPGHVTWPTRPTFLKTVAVCYSYVPYLAALRLTVIVLYTLIRGGLYRFRHRNELRHLRPSRRRSVPPLMETQHLWLACWLVLVAFLQERVFKLFWRQPRPGAMMQNRDDVGNFIGSCVQTCGMPSSHAALAMGWFTLLFLDTVYRIQTFQSGDGSFHLAEPLGRKCLRFLRNAALRPWPHMQDLSHLDFVSYIFWLSLYFLPVPYMRVVLSDHSLSQVFYGSCTGAGLAVVWWYAWSVFQWRHRHRTHFFHDYIQHNYRLPCFDQRQLDEDIEGLVGTWAWTKSQEPPTKEIEIRQVNGQIQICGGSDGQLPFESLAARVEMRRGVGLKWVNPGKPPVETVAEFDGRGKLLWMDNWFQKQSGERQGSPRRPRDVSAELRKF